MGSLAGGLGIGAGLSAQEEISEIKEEGNLEAVLNSLDKIIEEGKDRGETAW